uniref:G_PROTEIN_RECEP_F1_2 domain-containing protein n=1 Tax=Macrostomum lignano TaxID=282301 RepID=A0A1I8GCI4_9PLAT
MVNKGPNSMTSTCSLQSAQNSSSNMPDNFHYEKWLTAGLMTIVIAMTICGNALVILAVLTSRLLRQAQNFLIVSLACADMAVGILVLPLQVKLYVTDEEWLLPWMLCAAFTTSDIFFCTASILNLAGIAVDRYCAIKYPIAYATKRTTTTVLLMIFAIFFLSGLISIGPTLSWNSANKEYPTVNTTINTIDNINNITEISMGKCKLPEQKGYVFFSAMGSFYIPAVIIISLYISIFFALRRRLQKRAAASAAHRINQLHQAAQDDSSEANQHHERPQPTQQQQLREDENKQNDLDNEADDDQGFVDAGGDGEAAGRRPTEAAMSRMLVEQSQHRQRISLSHERRALRTLGIIMGIFMLCWLPFFVVYLGGVWDLPAPKAVFDLFVWLGYLNSALNPVIYTIFNADFRRAFGRLLRCRRPR